MKIEIETNGIGTATKIKINGEIQEKVKSFEFHANVDRSNKCKLTIVKGIQENGKVRYCPMEFFGESLRKFDEAVEMTGEENGQHLGEEK